MANFLMGYSALVLFRTTQISCCVVVSSDLVGRKETEK